MRGFIPPIDAQEVLFCKKVDELFRKTEKTSCPQFSLFLNLREQELFKTQMKKYTDISVEFCSGYNLLGERKLAALYPQWHSIEYNENPIVCLRSYIKNEDNINHRDVLGAAMNLMLKREYIGDIVFESNSLYIFCHNSIADIIKNELSQIKKAFVNFEYADEPILTEKLDGDLKSTTVSSLRIDAVISAALNISRSNSQTIIKQGKVSVNHLCVEQNNFEIEDLDIISVRQYGKYKIYCNGNKSRKDRIFIEILKY